MKRKSNIKLDLTQEERAQLRRHKVKITDLLDYAVDEVEALLGVSTERAEELYALADFQQVPSIGIKFAEDLVFLGYKNINELKGTEGAALLNAYEKKKGYQTDPCVEDQFRLIADFATNRDYSKNWFDFTEARKQYRAEFGYPEDRPTTHWTEVENR